MVNSQRPVWLVILAAALSIALCMGIRQTFGLYLEPISLKLGLGRESFALAMGLQNLIWGAAAPFTGAIADKYGAGRVVVAGALVYILGLFLMANADDQSGLIASGLLLGLGISGTGFTAVLGAVGRAASPERRSTALGITSAGGSFGMFAALPFAHVLIEDIGWTASLYAMMLVAALIVPVAWGLSGKPRHSPADSAQSLTEAFRVACAHKGFWLLNAGFFVCGFHVVFVATHLPAFLADNAFDPSLAIWALALIGLANVVGSYVCGKAGQIMEQRVALTLLYLARSVVFLGFLYLPLSVPTVLLLSVAIGLLWLGTIPLTSGLVATLFGARWMSMLFGIIFFSHQIGSFLGAWLGGYFYDIYQSYDIMWWISVFLGILAAAFHWPIREAPAGKLAPETA